VRLQRSMGDSHATKLTLIGRLVLLVDREFLRTRGFRVHEGRAPRAPHPPHPAPTPPAPTPPRSGPPAAHLEAEALDVEDDRGDGEREREERRSEELELIALRRCASANGEITKEGAAEVAQ
jgi:hypothetical protein